MIAICGIAWNAPDHTERWLRSVRAEQGSHDVRLYLLDNGSDNAVQMAQLFAQHRAHLTLRNPDNRSIYEGWNRLARAALADGPEVLILSNNDVVVGPGWLDAVVREVRAGGDRYFLPNGGVGAPSQLTDVAMRKAPGTIPNARAGWCIIFPARAVPLFLPIPEQLQLWYGDDYIHDTLQPLGWRCETIRDAVAFHAVSVSMYKRQGYVDIVARDKAFYERFCAERAAAKKD